MTMVKLGFDRTTCVKEVISTSRLIRGIRKREQMKINPVRRREIAGKLRTLRQRAWMYWLELPEVHLNGDPGAPWRFETIRVKR